mgnify:CR=1 FL=1
MAEPVLVQGTAVTNPHYDVGGGGTSTIQQHTKQSKCQDPLFAPLFYIDIIAIVAVAAWKGDEAFESSSYSSYAEGYYYASIVAALFGCLLSAGGLSVMMCIPQFLIKTALIFSVVMAFITFVFSIMSGNVLGVVFGLLFFLLSCCYAYCVW